MKIMARIRNAFRRRSLQAVAKRRAAGIMPPMGAGAIIAAGGRKRFASHQAFINSVLSGMACSIAVYECHVYPYAHVSTKSAMRGDWVKIGGDFNVAMTNLREEASPEK